jgi:hypothetical protein
MNAPLAPEILLRSSTSAQVDLAFASEGVQRYVWEGRWGAMLIEVVGGRVFVNGDPVESLDSAEDMGER